MLLVLEHRDEVPQVSSREAPSLFPHKPSAPALWSPLWPSFRALLELQEQELDASLQMWPFQHSVELSYLQLCYWPHCRCSPGSNRPLLLQPCSADSCPPCCPMVSKAAPNLTDRSLDQALWLCHPICKTLPLTLLNFILFLLAYSSSLSRSLCKMSLPSKRSPHYSVQCHQQIYWGYIQCHHPGHAGRHWTALGPASTPEDPTCGRLQEWVKPTDCHKFWYIFKIVHIWCLTKIHSTQYQQTLGRLFLVQFWCHHSVYRNIFITVSF